MHTYVVKNMEDGPIILQFLDGLQKRLNPGESFLYIGPADNEPILQDIVNQGSINVYILAVANEQNTSEEIRSRDFSWIEEGF